MNKTGLGLHKGLLATDRSPFVSLRRLVTSEKKNFFFFHGSRYPGPLVGGWEVVDRCVLTSPLEETAPRFLAVVSAK